MRMLPIRRTLGYIRLLGIAVAVAAGIAGFGAGGSTAPTDVLETVAGSGIPQAACENAADKAADNSRPAIACRGFAAGWGTDTPAA